MPAFRAAGSAYAVQFSPFDQRIAVGTSQNFGIIGNGKQYVLQVPPFDAWNVARPEVLASQNSAQQKHIHIQSAGT